METKQVGGTHYKTSLEPWDYIEANRLDYWQGNILKYITRWNRPGGKGREDLEKAHHYLEKYISLLNKENYVEPSSVANPQLRY